MIVAFFSEKGSRRLVESYHFALAEVVYYDELYYTLVFIFRSLVAVHFSLQDYVA